MPFSAFLFIVGALVLLGALAYLITQRGAAPGGWLGAIAGAVAIGFSCVTVVTASVGVPVTFGKVGDPLEAGMHVKSPFTAVATYPIRNSDRICLDEGEEGSGMAVKTAEQGQLTVRPCLSYRIDPKAASDIYLTARSAAALQDTIVEPFAMQAVTATFSKLTNDEVTASKLADLPDLVRADVDATLREYGVELVTLTVPAPQPSERMLEYIDAKLGANQRKEQAVIDQERSAIENETKIQAATAQAESNKIIAESTSREALCQALINVLQENGNIGTVLADPCSPAGASKPDVIVGATPTP